MSQNSNMLSNNKKLIAVIGATGQQGGAVVRALQASGQFKVRALSRNPSKHRELADEAVEADLNRPETLKAAFEGAHGVFLVTNFWEEGTDERKQATAAVRAAKDAGVKHFIWSTLPNVEAISGGKFNVPHFTGKAKIDLIVKEAGFMHHTFVIAPFYYQNLVGASAPQKQANGSLGWTLPLDPDVRCIHMGDISELGNIVAGAFAHPDQAGNGEYLPLVGDFISFNEIVRHAKSTGSQILVQTSAKGSCRYGSGRERLRSSGSSMQVNNQWNQAAALVAAAMLFTAGVSPGASQPSTSALKGIGPSPNLPAPQPSESATKFAKVVGWPENLTPKAPDGFQVEAFARDLESPRWLYVLPNGDVLVSQARSHPRSSASADKRKGMAGAGSIGVSPNRITLLRDSDRDGRAETREVFLTNLNQPLGVALIDKTLYVANTDGLMRFPYKEGQTRIEDAGTLVLELPAGGYNNHWTRNIVVSADKSKLYISVGSASDHGEYGMDKEVRRANILEINPDGSGERIFAAGIRNPVGMSWQPESGRLWTAVNERDNLGDDLVPDYITAVQEAAFYGWPYTYYGQNIDPRRKGERPDLVARSIKPDYALGSHTASLGLLFYTGGSFPDRYRGGAFIGQHGSWNRSQFSGYRVVFVPFQNGQPRGQPEDFLTGFMADPRTGRTYGRPVGITELRDGSLLVADDAGGVVWRVLRVAGR